jgi:hypothetical protein
MRPFIHGRADDAMPKQAASPTARAAPRLAYISIRDADGAAVRKVEPNRSLLWLTAMEETLTG